MFDFEDDDIETTPADPGADAPEAPAESVIPDEPDLPDGDISDEEPAGDGADAGEDAPEPAGEEGEAPDEEDAGPEEAGDGSPDGQLPATDWLDEIRASMDLPLDELRAKLDGVEGLSDDAKQAIVEAAAARQGRMAELAQRLDEAEKKVKDLQRGYMQKYESLARRQKILDQRAEDLAQYEARVEEWISTLADQDGQENARLLAQVMDLQKQLNEAQAAVDAEREAAREAAAKEMQAEYERLKDEHEQVKFDLMVARAAAEEAEVAVQSIAAEAMIMQIQQTAPEVLADADAYNQFLDLHLGRRLTFNQAIAAVLAGRPDLAPKEPPKPEPEPEPEPVPPEVGMMSSGERPSLVRGGLVQPQADYYEMIQRARANAVKPIK